VFCPLTDDPCSLKCMWNRETETRKTAQIQKCELILQLRRIAKALEAGQI